MFYVRDIQKLVARFAVLGVLVMIAVGCGSSGDATSPSGGEATGPVADIKIGMTEQQVIDIIGEPLMTMDSTWNDVSWMTYADLKDTQFLEITLDNGIVTRIDTD